MNKKYEYYKLIEKIKLYYNYRLNQLFSGLVTEEKMKKLNKALIDTINFYDTIKNYEEENKK